MEVILDESRQTGQHGRLGVNHASWRATRKFLARARGPTPTARVDTGFRSRNSAVLVLEDIRANHTDAALTSTGKPRLTGEEAVRRRLVHQWAARAKSAQFGLGACPLNWWIGFK